MSPDEGTPMVEPLTNTTALMMLCSLNIAFAALVPAASTPHIASVFMGCFGGLLVQFWTLEQRKPSRRVMIADIMASGFSGYTSMVMGVPTCTGIINKLLPEGSQITFDGANNLGAIIVVAGVSGMVGAGIIRKLLDRLNPGWDGKNGTV